MTNGLPAAPRRRFHSPREQGAEHPGINEGLTLPARPLQCFQHRQLALEAPLFFTYRINWGSYNLVLVKAWSRLCCLANSRGKKASKRARS